MRTLPTLRRSALLLVVPVALAACAPNRSATSTASSAVPAAVAASDAAAATVGESASTVPPVDGSSTGVGSTVPADFPTSVPLPVDGLVSATTASGAAGRTFDLTYSGADLRTMVADVRTRLATAGFTVSGDYDSTVKGVPSAGFVATSAEWQVVVGGQAGAGDANVSVSVARR